MDADIQARKNEIAVLFGNGVIDLRDKYEALIPLLEAKAQRIKLDFGDGSGQYADALLEVASYQSLADQEVIAVSLAREALRVHDQVSGKESLPAAKALMALARFLPSDSPEREGILRRCVDIRTKLLGQKHPETELATLALVSWLRSSNQHEEADAIDRWLEPQLREGRRASDEGGIPYTISWRGLVSHFPGAFKDAAIGYWATPGLIMSAIGTANIVGPMLGITQPSPSGLQQTYEFVRDWLFGGVAVPFSFAGVVIPGWVKDAFILYGKVSSALASALRRMTIAPMTRATGVGYAVHWVQHYIRHYLGVAWACLVWPYHFAGFAVKQLDPLNTYRGVATLVLAMGRVTTPSIGRGAFVEWTAPAFIANIATLAMATAVVLTLRLYAF